MRRLSTFLLSLLLCSAVWATSTEYSSTTSTIADSDHSTYSQYYNSTGALGTVSLYNDHVYFRSGPGLPTFNSYSQPYKYGRVVDGVAVFDFTDVYFGQYCEVSIEGTRPMVIVSKKDIVVVGDLNLSNGKLGGGGTAPGGIGGNGGSSVLRTNRPSYATFVRGAAGGTTGNDGQAGRNGYPISGDLCSPIYSSAETGGAGSPNYLGFGSFRNQNSGGLPGEGGQTGVDGECGADGLPGVGGAGGTSDSLNGKSGYNGTDGTNGTDGSAGTAGRGAISQGNSAVAYWPEDPLTIMAGDGGAGGGGAGGGGAGGAGGNAGWGGMGGSGGGGAGPRLGTAPAGYGGQGGDGGIAGFGGAGGISRGGKGGNGGTGASGGGCLVLAARGSVTIKGTVDISAGLPSVGSGGTGGTHNGGRPPISHDRGTSRNTTGTLGRIGTNGGGVGGTGGNGGSGGYGGNGGISGNGGAGLAGGYGSPGMIKIIGSILDIKNATIRSENGGTVQTGIQPGRLNLISNLSPEFLHSSSPAYSGALTSSTATYDEILTTRTVYDSSIRCPLMSFRHGPDSSGYPILWDLPYRRAGQLKTTADAELVRDTTLLRGFDVLFFINGINSFAQGNILKIKDTIISIPYLDRGHAYAAIVESGVPAVMLPRANVEDFMLY